MIKVKVNLSAGGYEINIGNNAIYNIGEYVTKLKIADKALVVSDKNVGPIYGRQVLDSLKQVGIKAELFCVPAGEDSKSLMVATQLYTEAIKQGLDRKSAIFALGGGVVGDLAGFVAATFMRGVPFVQIPTSLLAQVDSSVGGKVAVNHEMGKNLIGAFYQPKLVVADTSVLKTLPHRELSTGIAEVIKHGLITDAQFFEYLLANHEAIMAKESAAVEKIVHRSCEIKAGVVEQDEKETYLRMILNFGHTIAHAIETDTGYSLYNHGEAVAIGMHGAALISFYMGICSIETVEAVRVALRRFGLPIITTHCQPDNLISLLAHDKKSIGGAVNWVLIKAPGQVIISNEVPEQIVRKAVYDIAGKLGQDIEKN